MLVVVKAAAGRSCNASHCFVRFWSNMLLCKLLIEVSCLSVALPCVSAQPCAAAGQSAGDSLGLSMLSRGLGIVSEGQLSNTLTLGELKIAAPQLRLEIVGVTTAGYGIRNRADRIEVDFGFA